MLDWLRRISRPRRRIETAPEFREFLAAQAAFIAQRTLLSYCEVKAGSNYKRLSAEPAFQEKYEIARWETFAAVLADLTIVAEGRLRPFFEGRLDRLADELGGLYVTVLDGMPKPAHRPGGWGDAIESFGPRLSRAQLAAPLAPDIVAQNSGEKLVEALPIHVSLRPGERDSVIGGIRFRVLACAEEMERRVDMSAVARSLSEENR